MKASVYESNYHYTRLVSRLIESCFQDRIISVKDLAHLLNMSPSYVYFLLKKLKNDMYFTIRALPYHERIKLNPLSCFLLIESTLHRDIVFKSLSQYDYVTYISPYHGRRRGIYCGFLVPSGREGDLITFFELLLSHSIIEDYVVRPLITVNSIVMGFEWYDFSRDLWYFDWSSLLSEILMRVDADEFGPFNEFKISTSNIRFDFYDLLILHHLEHDIFTNIRALASKMGATPQNLSYHYRNHVHKLVKFIEPYWVPFSFEHSLFFVLDVTLENNKALRGFIDSLQRKPIAYSYAPYKLSPHPSIILSGILPYKELFNLAGLLDSLKDYGVVRDHALHILNVETSAGRALPYHRYDEFGWRFNLEPCVKEVLKLAKQSHRGTVRLTRAIDKSIESR